MFAKQNLSGAIIANISAQMAKLKKSLLYPL